MEIGLDPSRFEEPVRSALAEERDRLQGLMARLGMEEGEAIEARMLSGASSSRVRWKVSLSLHT